MKITDELASIFEKFPGIGPKQAKRFVYFILKSDKQFKQNLSDILIKLKDTSRICNLCLRHFGSITEKNLCDICLDENRNNNKLLIVSKELDIDAIEKADIYRGKYFVLGGLISFNTEKPSEVIAIKNLVELVYKKIQEKSLDEIIIALPVNDDGDNTGDYIKKTLNQIVGINNVKISTLARGLSSGLEIEYIDKNTFLNAYEKRY